MKKFQFSLEAVLGYKRQVLDACLGELGAAQALTLRQEEVLEGVRQRYARHSRDFAQKKLEGIAVPEALMYENGLRSLDAEIQREEQVLARLRKQEEEKRALVIEAKKETKSLEKLREKKRDSYSEAARKSEELQVEEFVSTAMAIGAEL